MTKAPKELIEHAKGLLESRETEIQVYKQKIMQLRSDLESYELELKKAEAKKKYLVEWLQMEGE